METLLAAGLVVLIIIGILLMVLIGFALRILLLIYSFFNSKIGSEEGKNNSLLRFVKGAGIIEIIIFLIRNRGRFRR